MAREGALEDPAVPPDVGAAQKHLPWPRGAPDVAGAGPHPDVGEPAAAPDPDVARAANGRRGALLVDSDTDVEEEDDPDVRPRKWRETPRNVPETPDVRLRTPNPDVRGAPRGRGAPLEDSETDVEEEEEEEGPDPDVAPPKRAAPGRPAAPDVGLRGPNPDVARRGALVLESDTDVEEEEEEADPDVEPPTRRRPGAPDVAGLRALAVESDTDVEDPDVGDLGAPPSVPESPDVGPGPTSGRRGALLGHSDTDVEEEEEDPDVRPGRKTPRSVPETPDVRLRTPNPDVWGAPRGRGAPLEDSETDVEEEDPDVRPARRWEVTQSVPETPDVRPNPDVLGAASGAGASPGDSETDVEEAEADPDVRERTQNVPETPNPDVGGLPGTRNLEEEEGWDPDVVATQLFPEPDVGSPGRPQTAPTPPGDPDVEEASDPDVRLSKTQRTPRTAPEVPDVGPETLNPDVGGLPGTRNPERGEEEDPDVATQLFLSPEAGTPGPDVEEAEADPDVVATQLFPPPEPDVGGPGRPQIASTPPRDPDVEEEPQAPDVQEEGDPDVRPLERRERTQNVPETPDVGPKTPNPDVRGHPGTRNEEEEEGLDPDVVATQLFPEPDVGGPGRPQTALTPNGDPDVEEEADPDVQPLKRRKITQNVPETPNPDVGGLPGTRNSAGVPEGWDPDVVATQLFLSPEPDVGGPGRPRTAPTPPRDPDVEGASEPDVQEEGDPDVRPLKRRQMPQNTPESPDVGPGTPNPDVGGLPGTRNPEREEEEDPDVVATQLFPEPDVGGPGRPQTAPTPPGDPDVEEEPQGPDVQPLKRRKMTQNVPETPDVGQETPNPDVGGLPGTRNPEREEEEDPDVATQLFLPPQPDVEEAAADPDVQPLERRKMTQNVPETPDVGPKTLNPDVGGLPGTRNLEDEESNPDVATQLFPEPDVGSSGRPRTAPTPPRDPDVEEASDPDVQLPKTQRTPRNAPEAPDVGLGTPNPDVGGLPGPRNPEREEEEDPDVEGAGPPAPAVAARPRPPPPRPDVGGAPGPAPEEAEAPPPRQVRRSLRLAESGGGGACAGPAPSPEGRVRAPRPRPRESRSQSGPGAAQATPPAPIKGSGRGSVPAPPPQQEEPAGGAKRSLRPRGALGPAPIRVLFTGLVASPALQVALGTLGGTEAASVAECSHLVTDGVRRTLKFLCALGRGVPIVTPEWLLQSSRAGRPLSPGPFLPQDLPRERSFGFRLRPALERARARPLLQGYQVHVTPSVRPCPEDMRDIVTCCGGTFVSQLPREHAPRVLVISCPQDRSLWGPALAVGLPLLSAELLLSGVLRQRLDIARFLLAPPEPPDPEKTPNPPKKPPNPPQSPPPSPPRTRSGRRPPRKTPNSGAPPKTPNRPQKTPKRPRGRSEDPDPDFGVQEPPRTRSRRGPPQNPPRDPPSSGKTQKTPNPTQNAPKQSRAPPGDPNPNFGVPDSPQELPRTRSGRRPPPNSGTPRKTPNPPPKTTKRPQNAPNSTQKRPRGPHPDSGVPESPPSPPRTRSRGGPLRNPKKTSIK